MNNLIISKIIQLYSEGIGTNTIATILDIHRSTIQKYLKLSSVTLRKKSPQFHYNVNFFSTYTPESCYWAGFLMADGYIRNNTCHKKVHIKLALKDREHIQKFINIIDSNYKIKDKKLYSSVDISGKWFVNDLEKNFGIVNNKSLTTSYPHQMPIIFDRHFIRGNMDGDGCITYTSCPTLNFTGTDTLLIEFAHKFKKLGINLKSGNELPPFQYKWKNKIGQISYSGKNAKHILEWLYANTFDKDRMTRKYEKYTTLFHIDF